MKKTIILTAGLLLAAAPAFAHQSETNNSIQESSTVVLQATGDNGVATTAPGGYTDGSNAGVSNVGVSNSSGVINQNVNSGASSNVGSATNVAITGGFSNRGGNTDAGNVNDNSTQVASAVLEQVNAGNATGTAAMCAETGAVSLGVANVGVSGSQGVISQQVNAGISSNVGSAVGISIH